MVRALALDTRWFTVRGAARVIGVSRSYVRLLVDTGQLRARRTTFGIRLIDRASVEKFAEARALRRAEKAVPVGSTRM